MYDSGNVQKDLIPLSTLHMMTSSHSLFLPTMLESHEEPSRCQAKGTSRVEYSEENQTWSLIPFSWLNTHLFFFFLSFQKRWCPFFSVWWRNVQQSVTAITLLYFWEHMELHWVLQVKQEQVFLSQCVCCLSFLLRLVLVCRSETLTAPPGIWKKQCQPAKISVSYIHICLLHIQQVH